MTAISAIASVEDFEKYFVIHPLDDKTIELKKDPTKLGQMKLTPAVRISLIALRGYLVLMTLMLVYHLLDLAGVFGK